MDYDRCERNDFDKDDDYIDFFSNETEILLFSFPLNMPAARGSLKSKAPPKKSRKCQQSVENSQRGIN